MSVVFIVYSSVFAQGKADYEKTAKGVALKLGADTVLLKGISKSYFRFNEKEF